MDTAPQPHFAASLSQVLGNVTGSFSVTYSYRRSWEYYQHKEAETENSSNERVKRSARLPAPPPQTTRKLNKTVQKAHLKAQDINQNQTSSEVFIQEKLLTSREGQRSLDSCSRLLSPPPTPTVPAQPGPPVSQGQAGHADNTFTARLSLLDLD